MLLTLIFMLAVSVAMSVKQRSGVCPSVCLSVCSFFVTLMQYAANVRFVPSLLGRIHCFDSTMYVCRYTYCQQFLRLAREHWEPRKSPAIVLTHVDASCPSPKG